MRESRSNLQNITIRKSKSQSEFPTEERNNDSTNRSQSVIQMASKSVKFKISENDQKMELAINPSDNIVQIKKLIYSKLSKDIHYYKKYDFCKRMRLKYNGNILDDNRCLLPKITDRNIPVDCEIDHSIDAEQIVIIKLETRIPCPRLLQMPMANTIVDLRYFISGFIDSTDYFIVKESKIIRDNCQVSECKILKDNATFSECQLTDGELVRITHRRKGNLSVKSVSEEDESLDIEYSNSNLVSSLATQAAKKIRSKENDLFLLLNDKCLEKDKFIFEYDIDETSSINFYYLMESTNNLVIRERIDSGYFSEIYKAKIIRSSYETLLIKYDFNKVNSNMKDLLHKGIIRYQRLKSHPMFAKLYGLYYDKNSLYVSMEYLRSETLTTFLVRNNYKTEDKIIKWAKQILEGIKILHNNGIVYRFFKPYDFLINRDENIKFYGLFLTEYFDKTANVFNTIAAPNDIYLSPEIRRNEPFDKPSDVWSFGVLMVDIISRNTSKLKLNDIDQVIKKRNIKENLPSWVNKGMKDLIEICLRPDPQERPTVDELLNKLI